MLKLNIEIDGCETGDLELALDQVREAVSQGFLGGANSNDTGSYSFKVTGEEEVVIDRDEDEDEDEDMESL